MSFTSSVELCATATVSALEKAIHNALADGAQSLLILASDNDGWTADSLDPVLSRLVVPVFGGIFPHVIFEGHRLNEGTLVVGLSVAPELIVINNIADEQHLKKQLLNAKVAIKQSRSIVTIVDGLSDSIERYIEALYALTGIAPKTLGGGAGSLDFIQKPCVLSNQGLLQNAAVIAAIPRPFSTGISHGWQVLDGPYLVTSSKGNSVDMLNYEPAFEVYKKSAEESTGLQFSENDFYTIAKNCPLGIEGIDGEILVRDPIQLEGASLVCVGDVPQNTTVYFLTGKAENLISAAGMAAKIAFESLDKESMPESDDVLVFDCISRALYLDGDFYRELDSIKQNAKGGSAIFGALTLGEIASSRNGPICLLNKSTTIAVF